MEKNTIVAIVLSLVVILAWNFLYVMPQQQRLEEQQARMREQQAQTPSPVAPVQPQMPVTTGIPSAGISPRALNEQAEKIVVETPLLRVTLSAQGGRALSWQMLAHKAADGQPVELVSDDARQRGQLPLEVFTGNAALDEELNTGLYQASLPSLRLNAADEAKSLTLTYATAQAGTFTKELTFHADSYLVDMTLKFLDPSKAAGTLAVVWGPGLGANLETVAGFEPEVASVAGNVKVVRDLVKKVDGMVTHNNIEWAAINQKYFTAAFFPAAQTNSLSMNRLSLQAQGEKKKIEPIREILIGVGQPLEAGTCRVSFYAGPKALQELKFAHQGFERLIDYGTFGFIAAPLAQFMNYLYGHVKNYGVVIIVLTVLIKIIFFPLTHKSYSSMKKMQDIQPQMRALQEKYKGDRQRLNQEMMKLYGEKGVNPMGGCLPMLLQIPVFFALYQTLSQSIELRGASFLWVSDLSATETIFFKPLVLLMGASMFLQQSMTPTTVADQRQAQMFKLMPIMFTAMFWNFPAGLVLYWFMNNILTIGQQYLINKSGAKKAPSKWQSEADEKSPSRKRRK